MKKAKQKLADLTGQASEENSSNTTPPKQNFDPIVSPPKSFDDVLVSVNAFGKYQIVHWLIIVVLMETLVYFCDRLYDFGELWPVCPKTTIMFYQTDQLGKYKGPCLGENMTEHAQHEIMPDLKETIGVKFQPESLRPLVVTINRSARLAGLLIGPIIFGHLSAFIGRKQSVAICYVWCMCASVVSGVALIAADSEHKAAGLWLYITSKALFSVGLGGFGLTNVVLMAELTVSKWRPFAYGLGWFSTQAIAIALGGYAICQLLYGIMLAVPGIQHPQYLHLIVAIAGLGAMLPFLLLVNESPRWLYVRKRMTDASQLVDRIAATNKKPRPKYSDKDFVHHLLLFTDNKTHKYSMLALFRTPKMAKNILVLLVVWSCSYATAYFFHHHMKMTHLDFWTISWASCFMIIGGHVFSVLINSVAKRRSAIVFGAVIPLFIMILILILTQTMSSVETAKMKRLRMGMLLVMGIISVPALVNCWLVTLELFPTPIRSQAAGFVFSLRNITVAITAVTVELLERNNQNVSVLYVSIGLLLVVVVAAWQLPETKHMPLEDQMPGKKALCYRQVIQPKPEPLTR